MNDLTPGANLLGEFPPKHTLGTVEIYPVSRIAQRESDCICSSLVVRRVYCTWTMICHLK